MTPLTCPSLFFLSFVCLSMAIADEEGAVYRSAPNMAGEYHAEATTGTLKLADDPTTKPQQTPTLRIAASAATGFVRSGSFTLEKDSESALGAVFLDARYYVKTDPGFCGKYEVRIFVPDPISPERSFSVPLRHFKVGRDDGSKVNGFRLRHKDLCAINMGNPNLLLNEKLQRVQGCEVRVYFTKASGTLWLGDVSIRRAHPQWSKESWERFEQPAGEPIVLVQGGLLQPMYERYPDHASPEIMDTVHKLLRAAGCNAVSEWIGWGEDFGRTDNWLAASKNTISDYVFRIQASNTPKPGRGDADYSASLDTLASYIENARYYGLQVGIMLQGTPDWTHPGRYNNRSPHSDFDNPLHNPGSATNGLSDPYPPSYIFKFHGKQNIGGCFNHCQYPPDYWSDWEDLAKAMVTRLKGKVLYYEIFNELQYADQGDVVGGYEVALEYLRRFHKIAHAIDPAAAVVSPDCHQMMPAMIANGLADICDWYGLHSYENDYEKVRRIAEAGGVQKHIMATEGPMLRQAWIGKLRGQGVWTACSLLDYPKQSNHYFIYLKNSQGKRVLNADPKGSGDRVDWKDMLYKWGYATGKLEQGNLDGASKADRIRIAVPPKTAVSIGQNATVLLTATNTSSKTYTNVRLWPIGFVDTLGFDKAALRASDRTIPEFRPGQTETIRMRVTPRIGGAFPASGSYKIGMVAINNEGCHSLAIGQIDVTEVGPRK